MLLHLCRGVYPPLFVLQSSVYSSKFSIPQVLCLPLLRKLPGCGGIPPALDLHQTTVLRGATLPSHTVFRTPLPPLPPLPSYLSLLHLLALGPCNTLPSL